METKIKQIVDKYRLSKEFFQKVFLTAHLKDEWSDIDTFFNYLKKYNNLSIIEFIELLEQSETKTARKKKTQLSNRKTRQISPESSIADEIIRGQEFETVKLEFILDLQEKDLLTKNQLTTLSQKLGLTKKTYKTKTEVYEDIIRLVTNRDILLATQNIITKSDLNQ